MEFNKGNIKKILGILTFAIFLYVGLQKLNLVLGFLSSFLNLIFPFLLGAGFAFILNVPMRGIENLIFHNIKAKGQVIKKVKRPLSLLLTLLIVISVLFLVIFLIVPEIGRTIVTIGNKAPVFFARMGAWVSGLKNQYPDIANYLSAVEYDWSKIGQSIFNFMKNSGGSILQSTFGIATSILGGFIHFFLGLIFAIYILLQKEKLGKQMKKLMYAFLPEKAADRIVDICTISSKTFSRFISGQCLEAVILGFMFFLSMSIFRFPYALMISALICVTALVPIFGSFIGLFIGSFLILIVDPVKALWFIILFIILQQIEGNLIYPHVVGGSVGLPSMWVLVAVTIGGSTMGIAGMLIFIPMASVVYTLLKEAVNKRLKVKQIPMEKLKHNPSGKNP